MKYKVIKGTDFLEKGDVFDKEGDVWVSSFETGHNVDGCSVTASVRLSEDYMNNMIARGVMGEFCDTDTTNYEDLYLTYKNTWCALNDELNMLSRKYTTGLAQANEAFATGNITEGQKVEATTVYSNLSTLVNHLQTILAK